MLRIFLVLFCFVGIYPTIYGQFYTGSQQEFGKNRVQYQGEFIWKIKDFGRFKTYYYPGEENLVEYASMSFQHELDIIEKKYQVRLPLTLELLVFKSYSDFKQNNIGASSEEENNVGLPSMVSGTKLIIYYETNHQELETQIRKVLAEYFVHFILYGEKWSDVLIANPMSNHPIWFIQGFASYYAENWNAKLDAELKDAFLTGRLDDFTKLSDLEAILAGHAFWNYIALMYGSDKLFKIIQTTPIAQHIDRALLFEIGMSSKDLLPEFGNYYKKIYFGDLNDQKDIVAEKLAFKVKKGHIYKGFKMSPDGNHFLLTDHFEGKTDFCLYDANTFSRKKIFSVGVKFGRFPDRSATAANWNPKGKVFAYFHSENGDLYFSIYNTVTNKTVSKRMPQLDKVQSFNYSTDGTKIVLSGISNGQTDVYVLTIAGNSLEKITDDLWDDIDPQFTSDASAIVFSSNRESDTLHQQLGIRLIKSNYDIFKYNFKKNRKKKNTNLTVLDRITSTPDDNEWQAEAIDNQNYIFLSDRSGILNLYKSKGDSSILFVDTAVHYRYHSTAVAFTNFSTSILDYQVDFTRKILSFQIFQNGIYKFYQMPFEAEKTFTVATTYFKRKYQNLIESQRNESVSDSLKSSLIPPPLKSGDAKPYEINFSKDIVLFQVSTGFLNATYQRYSENGFFNSTLNILLRSTFSDFFEDYKIKGAMRIPSNFNTGEFLGAVEFKRRRLDHQVSLYRQGYVDIDKQNFTTKWTIHELKYRVSYPFSESFSWRNTIGYRNDRQDYLAVSKATLEKKGKFYHQGSLKSELVWDNAFYSDLNTWKGWKAKAFAEIGVIPSEKTKVLVNAGLDIRNSQQFKKGITWVNRLAMAHSLGSAPIVYYLGGVDNWSLRPPVTFDQNQPTDVSQHYFFQTIATPMRGFIQNARNGNSFFIFNSEFRIPVFKLLSNEAVKSEVLRTFQLIFFADAGSAWTGLTPFSKDNHFNTLTIDNKPIEVQLINSRDPIVGGVGTGIRSKLFGYYMRLDLGWGIEDMQIKNRPAAYFSIGIDI